jgi:class 3 adenylate cyclase
MRLSRKYPIAFLLVTLGTALAIYFSLFEVLRSSIEKEISKRGTSLADAFALANAPLLARWGNLEERQRLDYNVGTLANDPEVLHARVADLNGLIVASIDPEEMGAKLPGFFTDPAAPFVFNDDVNRAYHFRSPIRSGHTELGVFVLSLSSHPLDAALKRAGRLALIFTVGISVAMSIFALLFVQREVRPLDVMRSKLAAIAKGDLSERMPEERRDEIGELASAFNAMLRRTQVFFHYVDKMVIERLLADESLTKPGGRLTDLAVVFGDMRGYTAMSNRRTPDEIVRMVNTYFQLYIECVAHSGGVVDKFMGDAIMAVFERAETEEMEGHKRRGVLAVAYMKAASRVLNIFLNERQAAGERFEIEPCEFGFAIASGKAIVGNIGSWRRMDYTVCGRVVNLASRLEGLTKRGEVILDNFTRLGTSDLLRFETLPPVQPKGYGEAEKVTPHVLTALNDEETHKMRVFLKRVFTYTFVQEKLMPKNLPLGEQQPWCTSAEVALLKIIAETPGEVFFARSGSAHEGTHATDGAA